MHIMRELHTHLNVFYVAKYVDGKIVRVTALPSEDSIHKAKRLDMPLQWSSKDMIIGDFTANALYVSLIGCKTFSNPSHTYAHTRTAR